MNETEYWNSRSTQKNVIKETELALNYRKEFGTDFFQIHIISMKL